MYGLSCCRRKEGRLMISKQGGKYFSQKFPSGMLAKGLPLLAPQHHRMSLFFVSPSDNVKIYFLNLPFLVTSSLLFSPS